MNLVPNHRKELAELKDALAKAEQAISRFKAAGRLRAAAVLTRHAMEIERKIRRLEE